MARVQLRVGGRGYALACRAGDEARLELLGRRLDARAAALAASLGPQAEGELLLGVAVILADELDRAQAALLDAAARVDAVAQGLERGAQSA
jgi:cell division protein ZapA